MATRAEALRPGQGATAKPTVAKRALDDPALAGCAAANPDRYK